MQLMVVTITFSVQASIPSINQYENNYINMNKYLYALLASHCCNDFNSNLFINRIAIILIEYDNKDNYINNYLLIFGKLMQMTVTILR